MKTAVVLGGNGFIGHHMARRLKSEGYYVRCVDIREYEYGETSYADEVTIGDLRDAKFVEAVLRLDYPINQDSFAQPLKFSYYPLPFSENRGFEEVYQFAADMGGAGYIFTGEHDADVMHNSATVNLNVLNTLKEYKFKGRIFYSSSACIYPQELQNNKDAPYYTEGLKEVDAYPANPDSEYGWEKLFSERLYFSYARNYGIDIRVARFHNIYGPEGTYKGGKEKAPAAICRKVIEANDVIEVWGDGKQSRSFLYIDDCIDAVRLMMTNNFTGPVNIGSEEMVTINQLVELAMEIADKKLKVTHDLSKPQGVRGRNSDNTLIEKELNWKPSYSLRMGLIRTFGWIEEQMM